MNFSPIRLATLSAVALACSPAADRDPDSRVPDEGVVPAPSVAEAPDYGEMGSVRFEPVCEGIANDHATRGLVLIHHMTYVDARQAFAAATEADPACTMGYWGQAMAIIHPLWPDVPSDEGLARGAELVRLARQRAAPAGRPAAYLATVEAYFEDAASKTEPERLLAFETAWREVFEAYPDDIEARALYALSHLATASPEDKTYRHQMEALELLDDVLEAIPDHPGGHHYVIHARDYPPLAEDALDVARSYGRLARNIPHALHMPTHIYTRVGLWDESIEGNDRSAAASWAQGERLGGIATDFHHALDYLAYAHLQRAEDDLARAVMERAIAADGPWAAVNLPAVAYALSAIPARYTLERDDWDGAAALPTRSPDGFPWSDALAPFEAITYFAKALGAARSGQFDRAREAIDRLAAFEDRVSATASAAYWRTQVRVQRLAAEAWLARETGDADRGLALMREAAALEASTEKHAVTPGEVIPASELLGEMLVLEDRAEEALAHYEAALARSPGRLNGLAGAAEAADAAGRPTLATEYYRQLLALVADPEADRPALARAREYLAGS